jgi:hypothetical protein
LISSRLALRRDGAVLTVPASTSCGVRGGSWRCRFPDLTVILTRNDHRFTTDAIGYTVAGADDFRSRDRPSSHTVGQSSPSSSSANPGRDIPLSAHAGGLAPPTEDSSSASHSPIGFLLFPSMNRSVFMILYFDIS